jgi:hypothetical protein
MMQKNEFFNNMGNTQRCSPGFPANQFLLLSFFFTSTDGEKLEKFLFRKDHLEGSLQAIKFCNLLEMKKS